MMSSLSHGRRVPLVVKRKSCPVGRPALHQQSLFMGSNCGDLSLELQCDLINKRSSSGLERFCSGKWSWRGFSLHNVPLKHQFLPKVRNWNEQAWKRYLLWHGALWPWNWWVSGGICISTLTFLSSSCFTWVTQTSRCSVTRGCNFNK